MHRVHAIVGVAVLVLLVVLATVLGLYGSKGKLSSAVARRARAGAPGILPGNLPVPGLRYSTGGGAVNTVEAMYWAGVPEPTSVTDIGKDMPVTGAQLKAVFAGEVVWKPQNQSGALTWVDGSSNADTYAVCPPGMIVTGVRTYTDDDSGNASNLNVHCRSALDVASGAGNPRESLGTMISIESGSVVEVPDRAFADFFQPDAGLYLTAVNALKGNVNINSGALLADQSNVGPTPADNYTEQNPRIPGPLVLFSSPDNGQTNPWKPNGGNHCVPSGDPCDGQNPHQEITLNFLYYEYGDPPDAQPRQAGVALWAVNWKANSVDGGNQWTYQTSDPTWADNIRFDPNRTINVTYDNGGPGTFKGLALANNGATAADGQVDSNQITTWYYSNPSAMPNSRGYQYGFFFNENKFNVFFNLGNAGWPANRMWVLPRDNTFAQTATFAQAGPEAKLVVTDPTCTGVQMGIDDKGNPINVQNVGDGGKVDPFAEQACASRAVDICKNADADDPYCACINAKPVAGLSAIGINLAPRCLSNGQCMAADPAQTWMDYTHADQATMCPKLAVDVCAFLWNMEAETIVLSNDTLKCSDVNGRCPDCTVGTGPCKSAVPFNGETACRTRQPDGTCGVGFVDCDPQPGHTGGSANQLANEEIAGIVAAGAVLLILVFVPVWLSTPGANDH